MERKYINFELKDIDKSKREAVVAHSIYDIPDRVDDISRKGMFTKSWNESKGDLMFYLNHDDTQAPGSVVDVFEDSKAAYTRSKMGTHTLGNDVLIMMDEGIIKKASFGFITHKSNPLNENGKRYRELKEVAHLETSVLTKIPAHPRTKVISLVKSLSEVKALNDREQSFLKRLLANDQANMEELVSISAQLDATSDLYTWISWNISRRAEMMGDMRSQLKWNVKELTDMKAHIKTMENFCRNTKASDDCIKNILEEIREAKTLITQAGEPLEPKRDWSQITTFIN